MQLHTNISEAKAQAVRIVHFLHQKGYAPATSSNYSVREASEPCFWVSESGIDKGDFALQHFMLVDATGSPLQDPRRPSAETGLHALIYAHCPTAQCVLHTHTVYNTILSQYYAAAGQLELCNYEVLKGLTGITTHTQTVKIPIFANTQHIPDLCADLAAYWRENPDIRAFLIDGHGLYTWASTPADTKRHIEVLEFLLECEYRKLALPMGEGKRPK